MNDRDRLEQLRALLVRLERMPESAEREWMLAEVRGRAVDVETGVKPAAMRARSGDSAEPEIPAAPKAARQTVPPARDRRRPAPRRPAPRATPAPPAACLAPPARRPPRPRRGRLVRRPPPLAGGLPLEARSTCSSRAGC